MQTYTGTAFGCIVATSLAACSSSHPDGEQTVDGGIDGVDAATTAGLGPRGVFVPTFHQQVTGNPVFGPEVALPYVDGFFVARPWNLVETSEGVYDWDSINTDIQTLAAAGKKITLAISAGDNAPAYVCQSIAQGGAGARCLTLTVKPPQNTSCLSEIIPVPWDPVVQDRFGKLIASMGQDILSDPQRAATVVAIKVTGFNWEDEETILPASPGGTVACTTGGACQNQQCAQSDAISAFAAAGYTDATATTSFLAFAHMFRAAFPGVPIGSMVSSSLPSPGSDNLPLVMVQDFVNDPTLQPIIVQDNGLSPKGGVESGVQYATAAGDPVGYQMLAYVVGNTTCLMGHGDGPGGSNAPCNEAVLQDAINNGISNGARWLEIYGQDIMAYPDASTDAHAQLLGP